MKHLKSIQYSRKLSLTNPTPETGVGHVLTHTDSTEKYPVLKIGIDLAKPEGDICVLCLQSYGHPSVVIKAIPRNEMAIDFIKFAEEFIKNNVGPYSKIVNDNIVTILTAKNNEFSLMYSGRQIGKSYSRLIAERIIKDCTVTVEEPQLLRYFTDEDLPSFHLESPIISQSLCQCEFSRAQFEKDHGKAE